MNSRLNTPRLLFVLFLHLHIMTFAMADTAANHLLNSKGEQISLRLALSRAEHTKGLSGLMASDFKNNEGMLFVNPEMGPRRFWMPDTFFNLDIIFLDENLKVVGLEKNVPAHPGRKEPPEIYVTQTYRAQYILEIKAGAPFGKNLKKDDQLKFKGSNSLSEIAASTRLLQ